MRLSLFSSASLGSGAARLQQYTAIEHQAIAAELSGFSTMWLDNAWENQSAFLALRLLQQLSNATDRIDLGIVLHLPEASAQSRFLDDLCRLDDISSGRVRLAFTGDADPTATLAFAERVSEALAVQSTPWLARRIQIYADERTVAEAGTHGFGLLVPSTTASIHARSLQLARYHDARGTQPGWVARQRTISLATSELATARRRPGASDDLLVSPEQEPPLVGTVTNVIAQLALLQLTDGVDEVLCTLRPAEQRADAIARAIEQFGRNVIPPFLGQDAPHPTLHGVAAPTWNDALLQAASVEYIRYRRN